MRTQANRCDSGTLLSLPLAMGAKLALDRYTAQWNSCGIPRTELRKTPYSQRAAPPAITLIPRPICRDLPHRDVRTGPAE